MKQLFKTTLLATAVAVTCGTAVAGTVAVTSQTHSTEGLVGVTAAQTSGDISYTVNAAYAVGDKITFTFTDGALASTTGFPSQINVAAVNSDTAENALAGMALGLLNTSANAVTYRVTSISQPTTVGGTPYTDRSTLGNTLTLGSASIKAASIAAGSVSVTVSSETSNGDVLDSSGTRTATLATNKTQYGTPTIAAADKFDGVINVGSLRKAFEVGANDTVAYTISTVDTTGWYNLATTNTTSVTLYGEAGKMGNVKAAQWASGGTNTFTADSSKLAISYTGMSTNDTITFTPLTGDDAVVIEAQKFTADFVYNYSSAASTAGSKTVGTAVDAGEWTLNGATVNIPYMPYGASASQIIYISNSGTQVGDISVMAFDDKGKSYDLGVIGQAEASKVTKIAPQITTALRDAGFDGTKASITITVNAPESDITVYSAYNVGGSDRGFVNTDQYKGVE